MCFWIWRYSAEPKGQDFGSNRLQIPKTEPQWLRRKQNEKGRQASDRDSPVPEEKELSYALTSRELVRQVPTQNQLGVLIPSLGDTPKPP